MGRRDICADIGLGGGPLGGGIARRGGEGGGLGGTALGGGRGGRLL